MADTETNEIIQNLRKALARIRHLAIDPKHQGDAIAEIYEVAHTALRIPVGSAK